MTDVASQPVDIYRFTAKYGPNVEFPFILSQPVDLYRWTAKYGRSRKCQKLWRRLQVDGHTHFKICHFRSTCRRLQVDGQFSTIMVSEVLISLFFNLAHSSLHSYGNNHFEKVSGSCQEGVGLM